VSDDPLPSDAGDATAPDDDPTDGDETSTALLVVGTRPEFIKTAPICRALTASAGWRLRLVHAGQHYDEALSETFFETLGLPTPDTNLGVGSGTHATQTAQTTVGVDRLLEAAPPTVVLAQGDTNTVVGTALAAAKTAVPFAHVEAGLRSGDREMPEEVNRVVADHLADLLFAPTDTARDNLQREGVAGDVHVTGNTVVDACLGHRTVAERESTVLADLDLSPDEFVLATIHRPRNTDDHARLRRLVGALDAAPFPVVLPGHPRTRQALTAADVRPTGSLRVVDPLDYLEFLRLLDTARVVVTDSGGVQEEASVLETPCLTVRPTTERPETVTAGVNELVSPETLAGRLRTVFETDAETMVGATDLYGDGRAGERIVAILSERFGVETPTRPAAREGSR
jgi:UDP-N-acetylglucosamine 2-epimerase (non-hydrolysing)